MFSKESRQREHVEKLKDRLFSWRSTEPEKESAIRGLQEIASPEAIDVLIRTLGDAHLAKAAMEALIALAPASIPSLVAAIEGGTPGSTEQMLAVSALKRIADPTTARTFIRLLEAPADPGAQSAFQSRAALIRADAARALGVIGDKAFVIPLGRALEREAGADAAAESLFMLRPEGIAPLLASFRSGSDLARRRAALWLARACKGDADEQRGPMSQARQAIADAFAGALLDPKKNIRLDAARSLEQIGWQPPDAEHAARLAVAAADWAGVRKIGADAVPVLTTVFLADRSQDDTAPDPELRAAIIDMLVQMGGERGMTVIRPVLSEEPVIRTPHGWCRNDKAIRAAIRAARQTADPLSAAALTAWAVNSDKFTRDCVGALAAVLSRRAGEVPADVLKDISDIEQATQASYQDDVMFGGEAYKVTEPVDCSEMRELAREELARRSPRLSSR